MGYESNIGTLYIDGEWNGYQGQLISLALVPGKAESKPFYEVIGCDDPIPWVKENVMPQLGRAPKSYVSYMEMQMRLEQYLYQYRCRNSSNDWWGYGRIHLIADWPEDIEFFCRLLVTGPGTRIDTPPITMEIIRIDPKSEVPHNALWDAEALAIACGEERTKEQRRQRLREWPRGV